MEADTTALERAFALAKSGRYASIDDIRKQLKAEGYSTAQISGPLLLKQIKSLIPRAT